MDATTTIEVVLSDPSQNFWIDRVFSYGDIFIGGALVVIIALLGWQIFNSY